MGHFLLFTGYQQQADKRKEAIYDQQFQSYLEMSKQYRLIGIYY